MDLKQILEPLGQEHVPGDEMIGAFPEDAVAGFWAFVLAAVRLLTSAEGKSPPAKNLA